MADAGEDLHVGRRHRVGHLASHDDLQLRIVVELRQRRVRAEAEVVHADRRARVARVVERGPGDRHGVGDAHLDRPIAGPNFGAVGSVLVDVAVVAGLDDLEAPVTVPVGQDRRGEHPLVGDARVFARGARRLERDDALGGLLGPAGPARPLRVPHVELPGGRRGDDPQVAVVVEVANRDGDRDGLEPRVHARPAAALHDDGRIRRDGKAGNLGAGRRVDGVDVAVGVAEDDLQPAEPGDVRERRLALAARREAVVARGARRDLTTGAGGAVPDPSRKARRPVRVVVHEDRAPLLAGQHRRVGRRVAHADAERHRVVLGCLELLPGRKRERSAVERRRHLREVQLAELAVERGLAGAARERREGRVRGLPAERPLERPTVGAARRAARLGVAEDLDLRLDRRIVEREPLRAVEPGDRPDVAEAQLLLEAAHVDAAVARLQIPAELRRPGVRHRRVVGGIDVRRRRGQELDDLRSAQRRRDEAALHRRAAPRLEQAENATERAGRRRRGRRARHRHHVSCPPRRLA